MSSNDDVTWERTSTGFVISVTSNSSKDSECGRCELLSADLATSKANADQSARDNSRERERYEAHLVDLRDRVCVQCVEKDKHIAALGVCKACETNVTQAVRAESLCESYLLERGGLIARALMAREQLDLERERPCAPCSNSNERFAKAEDKEAYQSREIKSLIAEISNLKEKVAALESAGLCIDCAASNARCNQLMERLDDAKLTAREAEKSAAALLSHRDEELTAMTERIGGLKGRLEMSLPAYEREQAALVATKQRTNAQVGADGENCVLQQLRQLLRSHADVTVTNRLAEAGDLQITWRPLTSHRPIIITIEVKTQAKEEETTIKTKWIHQAQQQIRSANADAGLLLYSGAMDATRKLWVMEDSSRLVVSGYSRDPGQMLSALLHTMMVAQRHADVSHDDAKVLTEEDCALSRHVLTKIQKQVADGRTAIKEIKRVADAAWTSGREDNLENVHLVEHLPNIVRALFPSGYAKNVMTGNEKSYASHLIKSKIKTVRTTVRKNQKRPLDEDNEEPGIHKPSKEMKWSSSSSSYV